MPSIHMRNIGSRAPEPFPLPKRKAFCHPGTALKQQSAKLSETSIVIFLFHFQERAPARMDIETYGRYDATARRAIVKARPDSHIENQRKQSHGALYSREPLRCPENIE